MFKKIIIAVSLIITLSACSQNESTLHREVHNYGDRVTYIYVVNDEGRAIDSEAYLDGERFYSYTNGSYYDNDIPITKVFNHKDLALNKGSFF